MTKEKTFSRVGWHRGNPPEAGFYLACFRIGESSGVTTFLKWDGSQWLDTYSGITANAWHFPPEKFTGVFAEDEPKVCCHDWDPIGVCRHCGANMLVAGLNWGPSRGPRDGDKGWVVREGRYWYSFTPQNQGWRTQLEDARIFRSHEQATIASTNDPALTCEVIPVTFRANRWQLDDMPVTAATFETSPINVTGGIDSEKFHETPELPVFKVLAGDVVTTFQIAPDDHYFFLYRKTFGSYQFTTPAEIEAVTLGKAIAERAGRKPFEKDCTREQIAFHLLSKGFRAEFEAPNSPEIPDGAKVIDWEWGDRWKIVGSERSLWHFRRGSHRSVYPQRVSEWFLEVVNDIKYSSFVPNDQGDARAKELGYTIKRNSSETPCSSIVSACSPHRYSPLGVCVYCGHNSLSISSRPASALLPTSPTRGKIAELEDRIRFLETELSRQQARLTQKGL